MKTRVKKNENTILHRISKYQKLLVSLVTHIPYKTRIPTQNQRIGEQDGTKISLKIYRFFWYKMPDGVLLHKLVKITNIRHYHQK